MGAAKLLLLGSATGVALGRVLPLHCIYVKCGTVIEDMMSCTVLTLTATMHDTCTGRLVMVGSLRG